MGDTPQHPDDFIFHLTDIAAPLVCVATKRNRESLKNPPKTVEEYLGALEQQGLAQTVSELRRFGELI